MDSTETLLAARPRCLGAGGSGMAVADPCTDWSRHSPDLAAPWPLQYAVMDSRHGAAQSQGSHVAMEPAIVAMEPAAEAMEPAMEAMKPAMETMAAIEMAKLVVTTSVGWWSLLSQLQL